MSANESLAAASAVRKVVLKLDTASLNTLASDNLSLTLKASWMVALGGLGLGS